MLMSSFFPHLLFVLATQTALFWAMSHNTDINGPSVHLILLKKLNESIQN